MQIFPIPALQDNLIWMVVDGANAIAVDPSESAPVLKFLKDRSLTLIGILNTHHHWDHVGGNTDLQNHYPDAQLVCSEFDAERIPQARKPMTVSKNSKDEITLGHFKMESYPIPGHTLGHTLFHLPVLHALFAGDTLFSVGCGRLFEGTHEQMWSSLQLIASMPKDSLLFCGHEYTLSNIAFAKSLYPATQELAAFEKQCIEKRTRGEQTLPTKLSDELRLNPFMAISNDEVRSQLKLSANPVEAFRTLREMKNNFRA